jgi:SAM-dependent methyltransferase
LSKGPNTKDDPGEEDSERRLRRRRKGGGLRVPSDNVPRRGRPESGEFPPPAPEDPRLAVSVAYAFPDERSGRRSSGSHDSVVSAAQAAVDIESPHTEPSARRLEPELLGPPEPAERAERLTGPEHPGDRPRQPSQDGEPAESTDREAEQVGDDESLQRYDDEENDRTQVQDADRVDQVVRRRVVRPDGAGPVSGLAPDSSSTLDYPLLEDDYEEDHADERGPPRASDSQPRARPGADRADSVDIPIEEVLDVGSGRIVMDGSGPYAAVRDALLATGGREGDGSAADALAALSGSGPIPSGKRLSDGTPRQIGRAQTMALSDADIEELDELEGNGGESRAADAGWSMPNLRWPGDSMDDRMGEVLDDDAQDGSAARAPSPRFGPAHEPVTVPGRHASPSAPPPAGPDEGHAAARGGVVRPMTNRDRDPGDSGEIIDDELIEEIEEAQRATPMAPGTRPPPIDIDSTLDLNGDDDLEEMPVGEGAAARLAGSGEVALRSGSPSSPPAYGKQQPPPAPSATRAAAAAAAAAAADPSQTRPRRRRGKPWFEDIFDEDYLRTLPFLTPQATQMEAQFVMDALAISAGSQVLDVGCGYGRHAMELAARGYHVVGLDSSLPLLLRGADEAQRRGLTINFVHGDMRDMAFDAQFDGAYCLFSTFGYFDDETNKKTAQNICRALKPGARCVFEVLNRDYIIAELPLRVWWEGDGCVVLEEVDFNYFSSRLISSRSVVFDDGRQLEQEISIRSFGLHELGKLLHSAGFRVVEVSGNMITKGRFFGAQSRDIVVIAERRVDKPGTSGDGGGRIP